MNVEEWIDKNEEFEGDQLFTPINTRDELEYILKCFEQHISDLTPAIQDDWVSVDDEWPEYKQGNKVLGFNGDYAFECEFDDGYWTNIGGEEMTHWKPLTLPTK